VQKFPQEILNLSMEYPEAGYLTVTYDGDDHVLIFTDDEGQEHRMECEYEDGKITNIKYNGEELNLAYKENDLVMIEDVDIDISKAMVDNLGVEYENITYNADDETVTLVDTDNFSHTLYYKYDDYDNKKLSSIFYGNKEIELEYDKDNLLVAVGGTKINFDNSRIDNIGIEYIDMSYDENGILELLDEEMVSHKMSFEYSNGKIIKALYDRIPVYINYEENKIKQIGHTNVSLENAPIVLNYTIDYMVNDDLIESVAIKKGNLIQAPLIEPYKKDELFYGWKDEDDNIIIFPYKPEKSMMLYPHFVLGNTESSTSSKIKLCNLMGTKKFDGVCICGHYIEADKKNGNKHIGFVIGRTLQSIETDTLPDKNSLVFYKNNLWYSAEWVADSYGTGLYGGVSPRIYSNLDTIEDAKIAALEHYFGLD
jgi:hypothetical protein